MGWLEKLFFEAGAFHLMNRGYMDFVRLALIAKAGAFFVTRSKTNLQFTRHHSLPVDRLIGLRSDHVGKPTLEKSRRVFPMLLRRVKYIDSETRKEFVFLTYDLEIPALTVAMLYKLRWRIELFFRWIKGHWRIKHYSGTSPNAVKTQIWIAVCTYLMIPILQNQIKLPGTLHRTCTNINPNQLNLFQLQPGTPDPG